MTPLMPPKESSLGTRGKEFKPVSNILGQERVSWGHGSCVKHDTSNVFHNERKALTKAKHFKQKRNC